MSAIALTTTPTTLEHAYFLILVSLGLGLLLTALNVTVSRNIPRSALAHDPDAPVTLAGVVLNSSNIAFLCVGVTSVMILVASDLARAFAVAAAIALVRFRIKMSESSGSSLFFAVIVGMACGVDQLWIALQLSLIFVTLQLAFVVAANRLTPKESPEASSIKPFALQLESENRK